MQMTEADWRLYMVRRSHAEGCPLINVRASVMKRELMRSTWEPGGYTIVGIVPIDAPIKVRNAGLSDNSLDKLDWLYQ